MSSDSILSGSAPAVLSKDFGKKKRTNRLAKLKQCKLDARREQWLSQVKSNKVFKDESNSNVVVVGGGGGGGGSGSGSSSSLHPIDERNDDQQRLSKNLETRSRGEENDGSSSLHDSDLEFLISSPNNNDNGNNSSRKGGCCGSGSSISSSSSSSSSSNSSDCCSGTVSEEEDDDGCLDDWEAVADALTVDEERNNLKSELVNSVVGSGPIESANKACGVGILKQECEEDNGRGVVENCRAWRPDDVSRPQSLPNLSKQYSFPMNSERRCGGSGREGIAWGGCHNIISQPISCPICYEDLDLTDSSFMPCLCGFRLCLFCHKRILEADGRCPGCRKQYDSNENGRDGRAPRYRFARSFSMGKGS